ncbi:hypothetical protein PCASD_14825 [Puccinia coronata f. sp. avenae]|uniref:Uncharacterized protein n=1 Tax=Puccinia coronata f. sp. avenae TaxID=200324 RepID=A0A2N5TCE6_9BASI|nr:hypothetical protein PCASD_14825 [Puccinia coronata f. sp. avenae]
MKFGVDNTLKERSADSNNSNSPKRLQPTSNMADGQDSVNRLQAQLNDLQTVRRQQNEMIANLQAAARAQALANTNPQTYHSNSLTNEMLKKFVKSPVKFFKEVNPQNPKLSFDGSNYTKWENAIDRTLQHVFVRNQSFLNKAQDNYHLLDSLQNKAVAVLMRGTLDNALLPIVESNEIIASKDLFGLLRSSCKMSGQRHKIILIEKILRFAAKKSPASESWLAQFCAIMSDVKQAKITVNKLSGLILQALAKSPPGTNSKNFEYSISQPLDDMTTTPTFGQVTTVIQSALSKINKGATLSPGSIPSDVKMSVMLSKGINKPNATTHHTGDKLQNPTRRATVNSPLKRPRTSAARDTLSPSTRDTAIIAVTAAKSITGTQTVIRTGKTFALSAQYKQPENTSQPATQLNSRICKIDLPEANDGTVLLDSSSTINVIGRSRFFKIKSRLPNPLTISLAISEYGGLIAARPKGVRTPIHTPKKNGVQPLHAASERRAEAARHSHAFNKRAYGVQPCQTGVQSLHACLEGVQSLHALRTGVQALHACRLT